jgi:hypothetical protein
MNNESFPTPESPEEVSREEVVNAYKKFAEAGFGDPAELDMSDPEVLEAHELYEAWIRQGDEAGVEHGETWRRHNFDKVMVNIDAGFTDELYLRNALDWLLQDADEAEKIPDDLERTKTRNMLAEAIRKVRNLLQEAD